MRVSGFWLDVEKGSDVFPPRMLVRVVKLVSLASVELGSKFSSQSRNLITTASIGGYIATSICVLSVLYELSEAGINPCFFFRGVYVTL